MTTLAELKGSRELLVNLTMREVRGKYKRTALGHGWSLINPLATIAIYSVVFGLLLRIEAEPGHPSGVDVFALFLTCGLLPWGFFSNAVTSGMGALINNANLVQKVYFPRELLVLAVVLSWDVSFLIEMGVLAVALTIAGATVLPWLPMALLLMVLLTLFAVGLALALSVANSYFRDTQHLIGIAFQLWFYLTPIVYPISYVHDAESRLAANGVDLPIVQAYELNPLYRFVTMFRSLLYDNRGPAANDLLFCTLATGLSLGLGYAIFNRFSGRIAEEL